MTRQQKGLTFIELMIVVAIIGFLATFVIPSYKQYTSLAQVSEVMILTSSAKNNLQGLTQENKRGSLPFDVAPQAKTATYDYGHQPLNGRYMQGHWGD